MALAALDQESAEFHGDPDRTYLMGLSMGGYGAWELAKNHPQRWAAAAIAAGGIFWSYAPERWLQQSTLPGEYARAVGRMPVWLFHGTEDNVVLPKQSELMFDALKMGGGRVKFWLYQGLKHDCWTRGFDEPELPKWLLSKRLEPRLEAKLEPASERLVVPQHPPAVKLTAAQLDALTGEYVDARGHTVATVFHQGETIWERNLQGELSELAAETAGTLFYPNGSSISRVMVERDAAGRVTALLFRDDRHEERWERKAPVR